MTITQNAKPTSYRHLTEAAADFAEAQERLTSNVHNARRCGNSWAEIGRALGMSKQAAQQKYGKTAPKPDAEVVATTAEFWTQAPALDTPAGAAVAAVEESGDPYTTKMDMLNALGPSTTTRKFFELALKAGLEPKVDFNAEANQLSVTVDGPGPHRGWLLMSQFPGTGSQHRHFYSYASMMASPGKRSTSYEATRQLREWAGKVS